MKKKKNPPKLCWIPNSDRAVQNWVGLFELKGEQIKEKEQKMENIHHFFEKLFYEGTSFL